MKKRARWLLFIIVILILSNIPLVSFLIGIISTTESFNGPNPTFSSGLGGFQIHGAYIDGSGQEKYTNLLKKFEVYKATHPNDTILYRHFGVHPFRFWAWYRYWQNRDNPFNTLPYKDPPTGFGE